MSFDSRSVEAGPGRGTPAPAAVSGVGRPALRIDGEEIVIGDVQVRETITALARLGSMGSRDFEFLTSGQTIALLDGLREITTAIASVQARALVQLETTIAADCLAREESPRQARRIARTETARVLRVSPAAATQSLATGRRLVRDLPGMLTALATAGISPTAAHSVSRTVGPATVEERGIVDRVLSAHLPSMEGCSPGELADAAERILHGISPEKQKERHDESLKERSVTLRHGQHGMATLTTRLTALDAARIHKGLSLAAEKARAGGDRRGHQQIMADYLADTLIGRRDGVDPTSLDIGVIITDRSLLAPEHADVATIEGYGAVPYEQIRAAMEHALHTACDHDQDVAATLRALYLDPVDGQLVAAQSRARQFPRGMARLVRAAHQTCRAPYCQAPIRHIDHITPASHGGETSLENANGLCAADNQKEDTGQRVTVITDDTKTRRTVQWTTRYGQTHNRAGINYQPLTTTQTRTGTSATEETGTRSGTGTEARTRPGTESATETRTETAGETRCSMEPETRTQNEAGPGAENETTTRTSTGRGPKTRTGTKPKRGTTRRRLSGYVQNLHTLTIRLDDHATTDDHAEPTTALTALTALLAAPAPTTLRRARAQRRRPDRHPHTFRTDLAMRPPG